MYEAGSITARLPVVAGVGELAILSELRDRCPVLIISGAPRPLEADVLIVDTRLESAVLSWSDENPHAPVLVMRERFLSALIHGISRLEPPFETELKDPARFVAGVALAARQMEAAHAPSRQSRVLTPRELEVLYELAHGVRIKGVASKLNISENTVKQHLMNARHKLGAADRITTVLHAIRHGLIPFPTFEQ